MFDTLPGSAEKLSSAIEEDRQGEQQVEHAKQTDVLLLNARPGKVFRETHHHDITETKPGNSELVQLFLTGFVLLRFRGIIHAYMRLVANGGEQLHDLS